MLFPGRKHKVFSVCWKFESIHPIFGDDPNQLTFFIEGRNVYEGGIFELKIELPDGDKRRISFVTPIYHPCVSSDGQILCFHRIFD